MSFSAESTFRDEILRKLEHRDRQIQGLSDIIFVHNRLHNRVRKLGNEVETVKEDNEQLKNERRMLLRRVDLAEDAQSAKEGTVSTAEIKKRDEKIAELTEDLYYLQKQKNMEQEREVVLHRQVKDLELELTQAKTQLEQISSKNSFLEQKVESLEKEVEKAKTRYSTMQDENQALQLEYNTTVEKLREKTREYDDLITRWVAEKQAAAEKMNQECQTFEKKRQTQVAKELAEAAKSLDQHDDELSKIGKGQLVRAKLPTRLAHSVDAHNGAVVISRYSKQGLAASGGDDKVIKVWDTTGNCKARLVGHNGSISCLRFHPSGEHLVSGSHDNKVFIYSLETFRSIFTLNNHTNVVLDAVYSNDTNSLFTTGKDHKVCMFDAKTAKFKRSALMDSTCLAMCSFMTTELVTAHFNKSLELRDPRASFTKATNSIETGHTLAITGLALNPDAVRVLTFSKDHSLKEFDLRMMKQVTTFKHDDFRVGSKGCEASYSTDGKYVVSGGTNGKLYIWDNDGQLENVLSRGAHNGAITSCAWAPSGEEIMTAGQDKKIKFWLP